MNDSRELLDERTRLPCALNRNKRQKDSAAALFFDCIQTLPLQRGETKRHSGFVPTRHSSLHARARTRRAIIRPLFYEFGFFLTIGSPHTSAPRSDGVLSLFFLYSVQLTFFPARISLWDDALFFILRIIIGVDGIIFEKWLWLNNRKFLFLLNYIYVCYFWLYLHYLQIDWLTRTNDLINLERKISTVDEGSPADNSSDKKSKA